MQGVGERKTSDRRMTARVVKEDPNTQKVQNNAIC